MLRSWLLVDGKCGVEAKSTENYYEDIDGLLFFRYQHSFGRWRYVLGWMEQKEKSHTVI